MFLIVILTIITVSKSEPPIPSIDLNAWWGPGHFKNNDTSIHPFKVLFDDEMIKDLRYRLWSQRRVVRPLQGVGFEYGFNSDQLYPWLKYWAEEYPFKEREEFLNQFPQYKTNIQGLYVHFIRVKPVAHPDKEVVPLLLLHGWPGSVREFYETIPHLTSVSKHRNFAVEVIAPSLPGFGFSDSYPRHIKEKDLSVAKSYVAHLHLFRDGLVQNGYFVKAAVRPGLGATEMGVVFRNLMRRLGHKRFYIQGGDWGAYIGQSIATLFPKEVLGYHTNLGIAITPQAFALTLMGAAFPPAVVDPVLADRMYPLLNHILSLVSETGYLHLQATKPDTLGIAMTDSPGGLMAYILQIFSTGTDRKNVFKDDGALYDYFPRAHLIDNLMMYWVPNSITTSFRIYAETVNLRNLAMRVFEIPTSVPTCTIHAKHEILYQSPPILRTKFPNLLNSTVLFEGGHFLAFEMPELFADDVLKAITSFRNWHKNSHHRRLLN